MVFLYYPNILGYFRFLLVGITVLIYQDYPLLTAFCYGFSQFLDQIDGKVARYFDQCSKFGGLLDMLCDRVGNVIIIGILCILRPEYSWILLIDVSIDITSHWFQMYASLMENIHHKESKSQWALVNFYYTNQPFLYLTIYGSQVFFITLYLHFFAQKLEWSENSWQYRLNLLLLCINFLFYFSKRVVNVVQLISASQKIVDIDIKEIKERQQRKKKEKSQ